MVHRTPTKPMQQMALLLTTFIFILTSSLPAQSSPCDRATYDEFVAKGQTLVAHGDYILAYEYFSSAREYCPEAHTQVDTLIEGIIIKLEQDQFDAQRLAQARDSIDLAHHQLLSAYEQDKRNEVEKLGNRAKIAANLRQLRNVFRRVDDLPEPKVRQGIQELESYLTNDLYAVFRKRIQRKIDELKEKL